MSEMSYNGKAVRPDGRCVGEYSTCAGLWVCHHPQAAAFLFSMGIIARNVERCKRGVSRPYGLTSPSGRGGFDRREKTERVTLSGRLYSILSDRTTLSPCVALSVTASPCQLPQRGSQGVGGQPAPFVGAAISRPPNVAGVSRRPTGGYYPPLHGGGAKGLAVTPPTWA